MSVSGSGMGFGFGIKRPDSIILKKGESVIYAYWKWWPPGYRRKLAQIDENAEVIITEL